MRAREELCSPFPECSPPPLPLPPPPCSLSSCSSPSQACSVVACHRGHQLDSRGITLSPSAVRQLVPQPQNEDRTRYCQSSCSSDRQHAPGGLSTLLPRNRKHRENIRVWGLTVNAVCCLRAQTGVRMRGLKLRLHMYMPCDLGQGTSFPVLCSFSALPTQVPASPEQIPSLSAPLRSPQHSARTVSTRRGTP